MVRDTRIKEYFFADQTISAATTGVLETTDHVLNGRIVDVSWDFSTAGSAYLLESGTGIILWERGATLSGAGWQVAPVKAMGLNNVGGSGALYNPDADVALNTPIILIGSALASGTNPLSVRIRYI